MANMSDFFHIDILKPYIYTFAVCKVDVKGLAADCCCGHYIRTFSPNGSYSITLWKYEHGLWIVSV